MPKPLVIGTEFVTVEVSDDVRRRLDRWALSHADSLFEALDGTGLTPYDIMIPEWRRAVYENDEEVVQAAIDSGLAQRTNHTDGSQ